MKVLHDYIYFNKEKFLDEKPIKFTYLFLFMFLLIGALLLIAILFKGYDVIDTNIIITKNKKNMKIYVYSEINNTENIINSNFMKIKSKNYDFHVHKIGNYELAENNSLAFQKIEINMDLPRKYQKNNLVIPVKIFTNKQRIYKKILKILF